MYTHCFTIQNNYQYLYTHCLPFKIITSLCIQMDASVSILSRGLHAWIWMGFLHRLGLHELYLFHPQP